MTDAETRPGGTPDSGWRRVAWAGIGLNVPRGWQPGAIERDGLRLEDRLGRPTFEFKRTPVRGAFSLEKHFARVARSFREGEVRREVPDAWAEALARVGGQGLPFAWSAKNGGGGLGAVLHFPDSGAAGLVQAVLRGEASARSGGGGRRGGPEGSDASGDGAASVDAAGPDRDFRLGDDLCAAGAALVLSGLRDHGADGRWPVALFDVRTEVPGSLELAAFHFRPGHFQLVFRADAAKRHGRTITELRLDRVAPADVVLGGGDAARWATKFFAELRPGVFESLAVSAEAAGNESGGSDAAVAGAVNGERHAPREAGEGPSGGGPAFPEGGAIEAACRPPRRLVPWLRERPGRLRVWSPAGSNRLLAVSTRGRRPVEPSVFEEVCAAYALVPS